MLARCTRCKLKVSGLKCDNVEITPCWYRGAGSLPESLCGGCTRWSFRPMTRRCRFRPLWSLGAHSGRRWRTASLRCAASAVASGRSITPIFRSPRRSVSTAEYDMLLRSTPCPASRHPPRQWAHHRAPTQWPRARWQKSGSRRPRVKYNAGPCLPSGKYSLDRTRR